MALTGLGWVIKNALGIDVSAIDFEGIAQDIRHKAEALVALAERVDQRISRLEIQQTRIETLLLEMHHGGQYDGRRLFSNSDWRNGSGPGTVIADAPTRSSGDIDGD